MRNNDDFFHFNHIDPTIRKEKLSEIKLLNRHYFKKFWCCKQAYKNFKRFNLTADVSSTCLVVTGTIDCGLGRWFTA